MTDTKEPDDSTFMQFLYVVVKEIHSDKTVSEIRIVHWKEEWGSDYPAQFVVYGKRKDSKTRGQYNPYRLKFHHKEDVKEFIQTIFSSLECDTTEECRIKVQLHQYCGLNNATIDEYNIEWENTVENRATELVEFEFRSGFVSDGVLYTQKIDQVLSVLQNSELV